MSDVQDLIDALAAELRRPTGVDDRRFRAVAYSSQTEAVDPVRIASILQREAPREVVEWLGSLGVGEAETYVRVPANTDFGMAARVCLPIRFDGTPLGFLWLIDEPEPLTPLQLGEAARCAEELGVALYRARLIERNDRARERELMEQLLGRQAGGAESAASELVSAGYLSQAPNFVVLLLRAIHADQAELPDAVRIRLVDAAEHGRRTVAPRHLLTMVDGDDVVVVLACTTPGELERRGETLARYASEHLVEEPGWSVLVGASEEMPTAAALAGAYEQARATVRAAASLGTYGRFVQWSSLGAYRILMGMLGDRDPLGLMPSSFERLLGSADGPTLLETLERYLDFGGDARAAAEALFLHRSSLYGRLHRIEQVAGVDLHSGEDRLELHIALRLWRLTEGELSD